MAMNVRMTMVAGMLATLAGCATTPGMSGTAPVASAGDTIRYETGPCYGACPAYAVTVRPDGTGTFTGERFTAVTGSRDFRLTPEQYRAFADALAPVRPAAGDRRIEPGSDGCGAAATDAPSVDVVWSGVGGERRLAAYFGCTSDEAQATRERLRSAPGLLPIAAFIGAR